MIQLEHLHIEDFRGIRVLDLPLGSKSFAVHGPNGSGKSGVVDAIDFALSGSIHRLSGAGTGGVSLLRHGPHVHKRDDPGAAVVELTVSDIATGHTAVLRRSIKNPAAVTLTPDSQEMRKSIGQAQAHPELTLSRREIIRYVLAQPGARAQEVQALLKLDKLDEFRKLLKSTLTKTSGALTTAITEKSTAETNFAAHLGIGELLTGEIAREINQRRTELGAEPLAEVTIDTKLEAELPSPAEAGGFHLATALRDVGDLVVGIGDTSALTECQTALAEVVAELANDPTLLESIKHRQLLDTGIANLSDAHCPLCDHEWDDLESLRAHLNEKLERSKSADDVRMRLLGAAEAYKVELRKLKTLVDNALPFATSHGAAELPSLLTTFTADLIAHAQEIGSTPDSIVAASGSLIPAVFTPEATMVALVGALDCAIKAMPDQSEATAARNFLVVAQDRWTRVRTARAQAEKALAVRDSAQTIYDQYCTISDNALKELYETVEADFSRYYQIINSDDEGNFTAELRPSAGSLDLAVDFYGLGKFPPTAYHSEGHQDGMGVCLYLALVKQLLGDDFRYAVLDDVVMSVDVNHRRQFCELLKNEFPNVQFIITTHDVVWARQMQSAGLITSKSQARFYGWTVDGGPVYEQGDIWERIDEDLAKEDVAGAAHKLRRRLEAAAADIAEAIGGRVPFRGDNNYDLSVLLSAVKGRHGDLLAKAAGAANSWGDQTAIVAVKAKKEARALIVPEQESEVWLVNSMVHNNDWANASVNDFRPVLEATRAFLDLFTCDNEDCGGWIYTGWSEDALRCDCGNYNLNLKRK
ncbi:MAG: AAA family ATPase [Actinobacteria bacterium]|nr:AAA family ATPase [Actinomycetota bacterium]